MSSTTFYKTLTGGGYSYKDCFAFPALQSSKVGQAIVYQCGRTWTVCGSKVNVYDANNVFRAELKEPLDAPMLVFKHKDAYFIKTRGGKDVRIPKEMITVTTCLNEIVYVARVLTTQTVSVNGIEHTLVGYFGSSESKAMCVFYASDPLLVEFDVLNFDVLVKEKVASRSKPSYSTESENPAYNPVPGGDKEGEYELKKYYYEVQNVGKESEEEYQRYMKDMDEQIKKRDELIKKLLDEQAETNARLEELKNQGFGSGIKRTPSKRLSIVDGKFKQVQESGVKSETKFLKPYDHMDPDSPSYKFLKALDEAEQKGGAVVEVIVPVWKEPDVSKGQGLFVLEEGMKFSAPSKEERKF